MAKNKWLKIRLISNNNLIFDFQEFQIKNKLMNKFSKLLVCVLLLNFHMSAQLSNQVFMGYQGWHLAPGDGSIYNGWYHWFNNNIPDTTNIHGDFWPDMRGFDTDELFSTTMNYPDGTNAKVYSAYTQKTVMRHFQWMQTYGITGVFIQRFTSALTVSSQLQWRDKLNDNVLLAAQTYGRKFAIMYDVGSGGSTVATIRADWEKLVDQKLLTSTSSYLKENGLPVVALWGLGLGSRNISVQDANAFLDIFQNPTQEKYRAYVIGGTPTYWRTLTADSHTEPEWADFYKRYDMISPWTVGRYATEAEADSYCNNTMKADIAYCNQYGIDYMPVAYPGSSAYHLGRDVAPNQRKREGGKFFWRQVYNSKNSAAKALYVAMFDEIDEGTAMYKLAETSNDLPVNAKQVALDADGYDLPSDWYLRLGGAAQQVFSNTIPLSTSIPIKPFDSKLVLHWAFDEGLGTTTDDLSDNNNTGTISGSTNWISNGKVGAALACNGSASLVRGTAVKRWNNELTMSAWVNHNSLTNIQRYITVSGEVMSLRLNAGKLEMFIKTDGVIKTISASNVLTTNKWYFVVGTWDGFTAKLYVDGEEKASVTISGKLSYKDITTVTASSNAEYMNGYLDELKIYNYALSKEEIQASYLLSKNTQITELNGNKLVAYPNPFSINEMLKIRIPYSNQALIKITSLNGTTVYSRHLNRENSIEISGTEILKGGIYLVFLVSKEFNSVFKLIVK